MRYRVQQRARKLFSVAAVACVVFGFSSAANPLPAQQESGPQPPAAKTIVIGFVGGVLKADDPIRNEVTMAERLREDYKNSAFVKVFKNEKRKQAHAFILATLSGSPDRLPSPAVRANARVILYGHSWGASKAIALARILERDNIPVLLTVQVDSVRKMRDRDDALIPPNVREAVNFYQPNGAIHGRKEIRAEDPARTKILGNFRMDYKENPVKCQDYPWWEKTFTKTHAEIECDPRLWSQIEALIRSKIADAADLPNSSP